MENYRIVRTENAGVFAGTVTRLDEGTRTAVLVDARRIWHWQGAATLSELAMRGTTRPSQCKFPAPVGEVLLMQVIEIISVTPEARASIEGVPVWSAA
jgi:hypothetical protein